MTVHVWRPTRKEILAAYNKTIPDVIGYHLRVLFCGINPSLYSAAVGHHFARPGNRFWPALYASGFTDRLYSPFEDQELVKGGCGITNIVDRATPTASELSQEELIKGGKKLERKVQRYAPKYIALVGISAYRAAFDQPRAMIGRQEKKMGKAYVWVLPNPSGLNAHYQLNELERLFNELYRSAYVSAD
jgi:TDG/mug DNA glycosylase family protein